MKKYDHTKIEKKWQRQWARKKVYKTEDGSKKPKFYVLDMFPYPSGEGLHVGHPKGYIATDIISRMKRMQGHNVLHPMGFDAFGLPAENYAIKTKTNPAVAVAKNIKRYKKQLELIGFDYDWSREISTTDAKYYRWTQWIFLQLLKKGLAYESYEPINWCSSCKTGLANEDVEDGRCERCGTLVEKRPMRQWVLKITDYADRLLNDLDEMDSSTLPTASVEFRDGIPCFTQIVEPGVIQPDKPWVERNALIVIVKHWSEDKYIGLKWKKVDWQTLITGAAEEGQTSEEGAMAEITEETGYLNPKFIRKLGRIDSKFFHVPKDVNRLGHFDVLYIELKDGERREISKEERENHEVVWLTKDEMTEFLSPMSHEYTWSVLMWKGKWQTTGAKPLLDWPESIKEAQRNWIGKSEGMLFTSPVKDTDFKIQTFSAHFEAFAADTFVVIAPDHPFLPELVRGTPTENAVLQFSKMLVNERLTSGYEANDKEPKGIFTGRYTIDPIGNGELPIWVASYALADYGTGIVKCSCHDERDFAFAKKYKIKLKPVLFPSDPVLAQKVKNLEVCFTDMKKGVLREPKEFHDKVAGSVKKEVIEYLEKNSLAKRKTTYRLKDWVFSRQRYWGEPIPVFHEDGKIIPVPEKDLPVKLPKVKHYEPTGTGESPLALISKWVNVKVEGKILKRETNTMPQWAGSSWYYLRYMDPDNNKALVGKNNEKYWQHVDYYVGGAEHATRHLIYARFWHKFLYDIGVVSSVEPFKKLQSVGLIMGEDGKKMSKRFGNVVNPDDIVKTYGADTLRLYEMFMGPFDQAIAWSTKGMVGSRRFLERVWKLGEKVSDGGKLSKETETLLHKTIKKVTEDVSNIKHNTAVSSLMILSNAFETEAGIPKSSFETFLKLLAPFTPHITEELWINLGNKKSIHLSLWPVALDSKMSDEQVTIVIQVNGKVRADFKAQKGTSRESLEKIALGLADVKKWTKGQIPKKIIIVPDKLVSIVVS